MSKIIFSQTHDYIKALKETEELKAYSKAVEDFKNDTDAQKILQDFQEAQRTYAIFRQGGFEGLKEQEQKVKTLQGMFQKNQKIQALLKTQQSLQNLVADLVGEINEGIDFPFTQPQRGGCCG